MSTMGTFDAFTSARLGIYAAPHGFRVTGNNISNINTIGYTRQRLDQVSFKAGAYDRYRSQLDNHVGSGALVTNINQIRDPTLDVCYRDVSASFGFNNEMLEGLERIASIIDEVGVGDDTNVNKKGDGRLHAQIQAVLEALRNYSANPTKSNNDLVRNAASTMCDIINSYARELEQLRVETEQKFNDQVKEINECLTNIRDLNEEIRDNEIFGDNALELRDERNRQIDKLSEYLHISVTYSYEDVGAGKKVEKLTIKLDDSNPDPTVHTDEATLIDGIFGTQLSSPEKIPMGNPAFDPASVGDKLESYRYLKQEMQGNDPVYILADGTKKPIPAGTDIPDGAKPSLVGTNNIEEAILLDNNNYGLQLGKLLDQRGIEWEGINSTWTDITVENPTLSQYKFSLTSLGKWEVDDEVEIGGQTFTIVADDATPTGNQIPLSVANDSAKFAEEVAKHLTSTEYDITTDGNNIVFTAKSAGKPGDIQDPANGYTPPTVLPTLTGKYGTGKFVLGSIVCLDPGFKNDLPNNIKPDDTKTVNDPNGTVTITSYRQNNGRWYEVTTTKQPTYELTLDDNDPYGSLQAVRELLTEKGEFITADDKAIDEGASKKRGIPFYQMSLDLFANKLASEYNKLNSGFCYNEKGNYVDADGKEIMLQGTDGVEAPVSKTNGLSELQKQNLINNGYVLKDDDDNPILDADGNPTVDLNRFLKENNAKQPEGVGNLFSNRNDGDLTDNPPINASNITVSHSWSTGKVQLIPKYQVLWDGTLDNSSQNINADHMVTMLDKDNVVIFNPQDIDPDAISNKLFEGSFGEMFNDMSTTLGEDRKKVTVNLNMYYTQQVEIDTARDSVSGVDLNDEAMNLMQYQKAYTAACRLMTVVDEALDRLINNTGIAGR